MAYGILKCDQITFTNGGIDQTVTVSGIVQSISGNITATGTIQAAKIIGTSTVSGATITGDTFQGGEISGVSGVFTSYISGQTVTGNTVEATTFIGSLGSFSNQLFGVTVTGDTIQASTITGVSGVYTTQLSGATITGNTGSFTTVTGGVATITSGVFALGTNSLPSISFSSDPNTGIYSPGADQVAISTSGTPRVQFGTSEVVFNDDGNNYDFRIEGDTVSNLFFVDASADKVGIGTTAPDRNLEIYDNSHSTLGLTTSDTGQSSIFFADADNNVGQISYFHTDNSMTFRVNDNERARIDSSGRLLVGTSSTSQQLSLLVQGSSGGGTSGVVRTAFTGATPAADAALGSFDFADSGHTPAARIIARRDGGTWTSGASQPTRLEFSVTADGSASPSEAMRINNAGELLVGYTSDNGAYKLQVNSQIFATSAIIATSDGRYKENVAALDGCVDLVKALRPVSFDWKAQEPVTRVDEDGETVVVREAHNFPDGKQVGFIAQEVEEVLADKPWLGSVIKQNVRPAVTDVDGNELAPEEEFLGIAEGNLVAVLTSALKDAIGEIESLKARVAALESA